MTDPDLDASTGQDPIAWARYLVPRAGAAVRLYLPGAALDARRRELVGAVVSGALAEPSLVGLHTRWLEVLGPADLDDLDDELFAWATRSVARSRPAVDDPAPPPVEPAVLGAVDTAVAHAAVVALTARHGRSAVDRLIGRRPRKVLDLGADALACVLGAPATLPLLAAAGVVSAFGRLVPDQPRLVVDPDPNLLTQLLADSMPAWLGGVGGRMLVANLPVEVPVAWRSGSTGATLRVGRGVVQIENGLAADAWALIDGDVDSLVRVGSRTLAREVRAAHAEP
ncbi:MAG: hypothetical protein KDB09_09840 [Acidimicrobiales bacterium]|nr:hypothetical protein [Acidimicrobiales bacterium]